LTDDCYDVRRFSTHRRRRVFFLPNCCFEKRDFLLAIYAVDAKVEMGPPTLPTVFE